jgi:hypothetical protein
MKKILYYGSAFTLAAVIGLATAGERETLQERNARLSAEASAHCPKGQIFDRWMPEKGCYVPPKKMTTAELRAEAEAILRKQGYYDKTCSQILSEWKEVDSMVVGYDLSHTQTTIYVKPRSTKYDIDHYGFNDDQAKSLEQNHSCKNVTFETI